MLIFDAKYLPSVWVTRATAEIIFQLIDRPDHLPITEKTQGILLAADVPKFYERLKNAVHAEKNLAQASGHVDADTHDDDDETLTEAPPQLHQRLYPLLEMMENAVQQKIDILFYFG